MYDRYKISKPYLRKDNRLMCVVITPDGKKTSISYPKYIMELKLGRHLEKNETVDHIDGNPLNNSFDNLRVMDRGQHCKEDVKRNKDVEVTCTWCRKLFIIKGSTLHYRNRKDRNQSGYFCYRKCSGIYGAEIQNKRMSHIKTLRVSPDRYTVKSAQKETSDVEAG